MTSGNQLFSDEFLTLPLDEKLERIKSSGGSDRSKLPPKVQQAMAEADARMNAERLPVHEPTVVDYRSAKKAV